MKIEVNIEDPYHSSSTITINVGQAPFRRTKRKQEIEGIGGTTEILVEVKKTRK
jgi:hypothetical protein